MTNGVIIKPQFMAKRPNRLEFIDVAAPLLRRK